LGKPFVLSLRKLLWSFSPNVIYDASILPPRYANENLFSLNIKSPFPSHSVRVREFSRIFSWFSFLPEGWLVGFFFDFAGCCPPHSTFPFPGNFSFFPHRVCCSRLSSCSPFKNICAALMIPFLKGRPFFFPSFSASPPFFDHVEFLKSPFPRFSPKFIGVFSFSFA